MTILWNGLEKGLAFGVADLLTSVIDPLPDRYTVQQGLRTNAEQNALFAKGRDHTGKIIDKSQVVTNARAGQSSHNFGLAIDVYPIVANEINWGFTGGSPEPTAQALPAWQRLWDAVRANGDLVTGADFALASGYDPGHIELANWRAYTNQPIPGVSLAPVDVTATSGDAGGASTPASTTDGDTPLNGPSAPPSLATTLHNWLELDPGVTVGFAAIIGLVVLLGLKRRGGG